MLYVMKIFKFFVAMLITLIFFELFVSGAELISGGVYQDDKKLSRSYKSRTAFVFFNEGFTIGATNEGGYLGKYYKKEKSGKLRIALIGDSFLQSFQLFDKYNMSVLLEKELSKIGINAEVLRFGYSGYEFENMFLLYEYQVKQYNPDFVIYFVTQLDLNNYSTEDLPHFKESLDGLVYPSEFAIREESFFWKTLTKCRLAYLIKAGFDKISQPNINRIIFDKFASIPQLDYHNNDSYNTINDKIIRKISKMNLSSKTKQLFCVNIKGEELKVHKSYMHTIEHANIPLITFEPVFKKMISKGRDPLYWKATNKSGHWNHEAHKKIAEYLAVELKPIVKNYR